MEMALTFNAVEFATVSRNNQPWVRGIQIGYALDYRNPAQAISKLYETHADEFTDEMTAVVKLPTEGGDQDVRIFSLRGCHLLAMFARTPVAKAFRKWVLDVLDRLDRERLTGRYSEMTEEEKRESWQGSLDALNYWYQTHPVTHKRISMDEREAIARELGIAREKVSSAPMEEPEQPRTTVAVNGMNKALKTSKDIGEAIRLVDDIYMRLRNELRPVTPRPWGNTAELRKKAEARYDLQWDMFRAATNSLHAALAALCAAAEVADMS